MHVHYSTLWHCIRDMDAGFGRWEQGYAWSIVQDKVSSSVCPLCENWRPDTGKLSAWHYFSSVGQHETIFLFRHQRHVKKKVFFTSHKVRTINSWQVVQDATKSMEIFCTFSKNISRHKLTLMCASLYNLKLKSYSRTTDRKYAESCSELCCVPSVFVFVHMGGIMWESPGKSS